jgi:hypothetical protein
MEVNRLFMKIPNPAKPEIVANPQCRVLIVFRPASRVSPLLAELYTQEGYIIQRE